jgi:hypothetical protein
MTPGDTPPAGGVAEPVLHCDKSDLGSPTRRLLDRIADIGCANTGWVDEFAEKRRAEIDAQGDEPWV